MTDGILGAHATCLQRIVRALEHANESHKIRVSVDLDQPLHCRPSHIGSIPWAFWFLDIVTTCLESPSVQAGVMYLHNGLTMHQEEYQRLEEVCCGMGMKLVEYRPKDRP